MSYPILALWAHPRSMSTAIERAMRHRSDCYVFHEPFLMQYYRRIGKKIPGVEMNGFDVQGGYEATRSDILKRAETQPVFIKDMSYHVLPMMFGDLEFATRLFNVFLLRDPRKSIASYYKQDKGLTLEEVGIEAQWRHQSFLRNAIPYRTMVVGSEDIGRRPNEMMRFIWQAAGFANEEAALQWQDRAMPKELMNVESWHQNLIKADGIYHDQRDPDKVFTEAVEKAPHLAEYRAHHQPFYEQLIEQKVNI
ncbi:MAG: hypothetical protein ABJQ34_19120 [Paracoccaceae bacterium]